MLNLLRDVLHRAHVAVVLRVAIVALPVAVPIPVRVPAVVLAVPAVAVTRGLHYLDLALAAAAAVLPSLPLPLPLPVRCRVVPGRLLAVAVLEDVRASSK